jgi:tetratricopeptide (TPR) repeat protein
MRCKGSGTSVEEGCVSQPLLSLCVIARDEETTLGRCLESAKRWVDESIVVDTGSADGTIARAEAAGARVLRHPWGEDFSEARNVALDAARGRFILVLDADEWIEFGPHAASFRALLASDRDEAYTVDIADRLDGGVSRSFSLVRLFRNRPEHRYAGAIHEQIAPSIAARLGVAEIAAPPSGLVVGHDGYARQERMARGKAERNLALLRRRVRDNPGDAAARYFLARECTPIVGGRAVPGEHLDEALVHLEWLAREGDLAATIAADAARLHAAALLARGRIEDASEVLAARGDSGVACDLLRADAEAATPDRALALAKACFDRETRDRGPFSEPALAGPVARARAAEALMHLGRHDEARILCEEAMLLPGAGALPWIVLGAIARAEDDTVAAMRAYVVGLGRDAADPWAWAANGELLLASGDPEQSIDPLCRAAELAPGWDTVEEAVTTALLLEGREREAMEAFAERAALGRPAPEAAMLLAAALSGDACPMERIHPGAAESVRRVLGRVAAAGRPDLLHRLSLGLRAGVGARA